MSLAPEPLWLALRSITILHDDVIEEHGGLPGVRDQGALESAVARPRNKWNYGEDDVMRLAAAYGYGLARNHAFSDGNKRIAYVAAELFLALNGFRLVASDDDKIATFLALAAGELSEDALAGWLRSRAQPA
ncbi:type II toxin-antitoxin system death-on-curing family toxin [Chenggangzhangella methanolivorans]|uniref:Type II toxin-antitoxin system death-on-curing family toxin n=1 Tax=Chenggangzhangella methanolivorans TaxID=1437009 RepID=A0A9E6R6K8_9HYPH|nr:type II toxin-antitoxin system death-on-curing family toxin [Chenggangzhangella methanolivorans]QZN98346.1 type II toxin-antitoxin system death-on-curing family toxin [Chenggangzhangella methanolivorans]